MPKNSYANLADIMDWDQEASAIIDDVKPHVGDIWVSNELPKNPSGIYLNVRTIEGGHYCVKLFRGGLWVVSNEFDTTNEDQIQEHNRLVFETPSALLNTISPAYVQSFGHQLARQLLELAVTKKTEGHNGNDLEDDSD